MTKQQRSTKSTVPNESVSLTRRKMRDGEVLRLHTPYYPMFESVQPFEAALFGLFNSMCKQYTGGMWSYYMLSNGAWYMAPDDKMTFRLRDLFGREGCMSADGAGLATTLYMLNTLSWRSHVAGDQCDLYRGVAALSRSAHVHLHPPRRCSHLGGA